MRKNFGKKTWMYPLPVLMIGTYGEDGTANVMNAAWGGIYDTCKVVLCLSATHKTTENIRKRGAFTVSFADKDHLVAADYVGIVSGNKEPDKFSKAGFHASKSEFVDAPLIDEFPMTLECKLEKINEDGNIIGEIVNVSVDESILDEEGTVDLSKWCPITFDPVHSTYTTLGEKAGNAFSDGKALC